MKLRTVLLFAFLAGLLAFGFTHAGDIGSVEPISGGAYWSPMAKARCGLSLQLLVTVKDGYATVEANGAPGSRCIWIDMEVEFWMRDAETGQWVKLDEYTGSDLTWQSDTFDCDGYDKFEALGSAKDQQEESFAHSEQGLVGSEHTVSTSVSN